MTSRNPIRTAHRRPPKILVAGLLVVMATIGAALGYQLRAFSSSPASSTAASLIDVIRSENRVAPDVASGAIPGGTTVFDDEIPGVANLDPSLLAALRVAAS